MKAVPQGIEHRADRGPAQRGRDTRSASSCIPSSRRWRSCCSSPSWRSGWRTGIVVALSVPLVLGIVFIVMNAMSLDLHRITLGALIIALGLLVDDAIIAVEMMVVKMEQGWDRFRAASFAWESTAFPMLTGTLVTAAGFLPIGFANSAVGEYAGGIFWIVAIALVASWFVAVIFTPYIGVKLLPNIKVAATTTIRTRSTRHGCIAACAASCQWCVDHRIKVVAGDRRRVRGWRSSASARPAAVLPAVGAARAVPAAAAAGRHRLQRHREIGEARPRKLLKDDKDIATYHRLCRPGFAALLARPQSAAAERGLCRDRDRRQGRRRPRADQGADREGSRHDGDAERSPRSRRPLQFRSAGRLPRAIPRDRARRRTVCATSPTRCATWCGRTRT